MRRLIAAAVLAAMSDGVPAADAPPGPPPLCATCHGPLGVSNTPDAPNLAGQPRIYLVQQLRAFRSGKRVHEVMNVVAKPLKDEEIDAIAEWYAAIAIEAKPKR